MMGSTHAATGAAVGCVATAAYLTLTGQDPTFAHLAAGTLTAAGATLLPDLDHPNATATHSLGPVTRAVSLVLQWASKAIYKATGTKYDSDDRVHRTFTHTLVFAVLVGALAGLAAAQWETATVAILCFLVSLALRAALAHFQPSVRQRDPRTMLGVLVSGAVIAVALVWFGDVSPVYLGVTAGLGVLTGVLGDMVTKERAPLLWPLKINGKRWWNLGLPPWACITTGDDSMVERFLRWAGWGVPVLTCVLVFWPASS